VDVEGEIPRELRGTFSRMGPGYQHAGADLLQFYDGFGLLSGVGFRDGRAYFRSAHVRSALLEQSLKAGHLARRGTFTNTPSRLRNMLKPLPGNFASHDVYTWAGKVYATGDVHYALDPRTFATLGEERYGRPAGQPLTLMPRRDARRGRLVAYSVKPGVFGPDEVSFFEVDAAGNRHEGPRARLRRSIQIIHDVAFTDRWYVVIQLPLQASLPRILWGEKPFLDALQPIPGETPVVTLVPRDGKGLVEPVEVPLPPGAMLTFHMVNAFDGDDGRVVVDIVGTSDFYNFVTAGPKALREMHGVAPTPPPGGYVARHTIDPATRAVVHTRKVAGDGEQPEIHPALHGQRTRYGYVRAQLFDGSEPEGGDLLHAHGFAKVDFESGSAETWSAGPHRFCGAPAFAPRPAAWAAPSGHEREDDGWVLTWVVDGDAGTTEVAIHDARRVAAGPIATLRLGVYVPLPGHVAYDPEIEIF
jgi:all-trans-8'-apo-beta-carotenal 15,15'-oxygenase